MFHIEFGGPAEVGAHFENVADARQDDTVVIVRVGILRLHLNRFAVQRRRFHDPSVLQQDGSQVLAGEIELGIEPQRHRTPGRSCVDAFWYKLMDRNSHDRYHPHS